MITYLSGDATKPDGEGDKIVAHVCNNVGAWGAGFVLSLSKKWPVTKQYYLDMRPYVLGNVGFIQVEPKIIVANMIAQDGIGMARGVPLKYNHLGKCLEAVYNMAKNTNSTVHMPRIGTGLAGGSWSIISQIISSRMEDVPVFIYNYENAVSRKI